MKQFLLYWSVAIFSILIGGQITEGALLVPYWQSLSSADFYSYYNEFGPFVNKFFSVLTIAAALVPIIVLIYSRSIKSDATKYALISSFFAILFVSSFYIYFKGANASFFDAALSDVELKQELVTWGNWHWGRIVVQFLSLIFLILALIRIQDK